ncbi:hypothetical protein ACFL5W_02685, partial [Thermodesulfobacteriota bacterium]
WEAFPNKTDIKYDKNKVIDSISNIRYDLRVWWTTNGWPDKLVYSKENIMTNEHKIEINLEPDSYYLWSVRARFDLDGQERFTRWAYSGYPFNPGRPTSITPEGIMIGHHFRFKTP